MKLLPCPKGLFVCRGGSCVLTRAGTRPAPTWRTVINNPLGVLVCSLALFIILPGCTEAPPETGTPQMPVEAVTEIPTAPPEPATVLPAEEQPDYIPKTPNPEYERLRMEYGNDDIVGALRIEGTSIDYLVTQAPDNEYYLTHDIHRQQSNSGWIFLDYENDTSRGDRHMIIYGHNMRDGGMFHSLADYTSEEFLEAHRQIIFNTAYEDGVWEVFSFHKATTEFRYLQVIFPTREDFAGLVSEMKARSLFETGVDVGPDDRILTLSTCGNSALGERYVLHAKLQYH